MNSFNGSMGSLFSNLQASDRTLSSRKFLLKNVLLQIFHCKVCKALSPSLNERGTLVCVASTTIGLQCNRSALADKISEMFLNKLKLNQLQVCAE